MQITAILSMAAKAAFPKDYRHGTSRPWTIADEIEPTRQEEKVFIEPIAYEDWSVFKRGHTVEILSGKDKGKQGKVAQVFRHRNWVILEGYIGKSADYPGTYSASEAPLLLRDISLETDRGGVEVHRGGGEGALTLRTGRIVPKPVFQRRDGIVPQQLTRPPSSLEEEVMEKLGIEEPRRNRKTYW
uniref:Large ribosomal subunit protein uL24m n=1 Tax=Salmo trutta TaxID=8032 RepID=A0A674D6I3_SALTR